MNAEVSSGNLSRRDTRDAHDQQETSDGRCSPRYAVSASAEVVEPYSRARLAARVTDLSMGGCYVDAMSPFIAGTEVHIRLVSESRLFQSQARVLYSTPGMGMGLAFTKMTSEHLEILSDWMRALGNELPAPELTGDAVFDFELQTKSPATAGAGNLHEIIGELVRLMARKRLLIDQEAGDLQKKLSRSAG